MLVSGEAGIGKTSLVRAFTDRLRAGRVLAGACDDLLTRGRSVRCATRCGASAGRSPPRWPRTTPARCSRPCSELADPHGPTVLVVEDVHWADSATLDLLRHVGRRIDDVPALLLLTYRPDEIGREHPLLGVLGSLAGRAVRRLPLGGCPDAVAELAGGRRSTRSACTGPPRAIRSSSPRPSRRRTTRCRAPSSTPCWPGCTG